MISPQIGDYERHDIDALVSKVIRGLGNPEPPVRLDDVRELQRLDRGYYSSSDDSVLRETISRLRVAGKQLFERPTLLLDVVRQWKLSALWIPDRKRILLDRDLPPLKQRWSEAHEVGHHLVPWHADFLLGDDAASLSQECHEQLEAEANYAAGQLLFLQERFRSEALDSTPSMDRVRSLSKRYGNTITSTLWRFIEARQEEAVFGVVSERSKIWSGAPCRYFIQSSGFRTEFPSVTEAQVAAVIASYCRSGKRGGPAGSHESVLVNARGEPVIFHFDSFSNSYDVLTIGRAVRPHLRVVGF